MRKTDFAGLTELDPGESLFADGSSFTARNPSIIDHYLRIGAQTHRHTGAVALTDPQTLPTLTTNVGGGAIPPNTTVLVGYTKLDVAGGETLLSPTALVTTGGAIEAPTETVELEVVYGSGNLTVGTYRYLVTLVDSTGGETTPSPVASIVRAPGQPNASIRITGISQMVAETAGAVRWRLYKAKDAATPKLLAEAASGIVVDDGSLDCDCCTVPPTVNTTNANNSLTVTVPLDAVADAAGWRLYVTEGDFTSPSKYGPDRPVAEAGQPIPIAELLVADGAPPDVATTVGGAQKIDPDLELYDWHWKRPVATPDALPQTSDDVNGDVRMVLSDGAIYIRREGAWTPYTAPAAHWKPPLPTAADLPNVGNDQGDVRLILSDFSLHAWVNGAWTPVAGSQAQTRGHVIADEGAALAARSKLSFVGGGIRAFDDPGSDRTVVQVDAPPPFPTLPTAGHTIVNQTTQLPARDKLAFQGPGVVASDDASGNRTIVTIAGGGGGGGGATGPLGLTDLVEWQVDGVTAAQIGVTEAGATVTLIDTEFTAADPVASEWLTEAFKITGGYMVPRTDGTHPAVANQDTWAFRQRPGRASMRMSMQAQIVNAGWNKIGLVCGGRITAYGGDNDTVDPITAYLDRAAGTMKLTYKQGRTGALTTLVELGAADGYTPPAIGDIVELDLELDVAGGLRFDGAIITPHPGTDADVRSLPTATAPRPAIEPGWPGLLLNWSDKDAVRIDNYSAREDVVTRQIVATAWHRGWPDVAGQTVLVDTGVDRGPTLFGTAGDSGFTGASLAAGWTNPDTGHVALVKSSPDAVEFSGRLYRTGVAPTVGELIGTVPNYSAYTDKTVPIVTGDDDGQQLGMLTINTAGELRWQAGRSTTKAAYVELSGLRVLRG